MRANLSICVAMLILVSGVTSALTLEQFSEQCTIKSLEAARAGQYPLSICLASSVPSAMDVRKGYPVSLVICNASSVTWQPQNVSLVQANNVNWGTEAKTIPLDSPLSPGKAKLLTFNVTSPSKPGSYPKGECVSAAKQAACFCGNTRHYFTNEFRRRFGTH